MIDDSNKPGTGQIGGVNISGGTITVGGDLIGQNKTVITHSTNTNVDEALHAITEVVKHISSPCQSDAIQKVEALRVEASKGKSADDHVMAKLIEGIVALVPGAIGAVVSAFGTPLLGGIAGPATKYVLDKIRDV